MVVAAVAVENVPVGQFWQALAALAPVVPENFPAAQAVHAPSRDVPPTPVL
jgi:hypothetical protein